MKLRDTILFLLCSLCAISALADSDVKAATKETNQALKGISYVAKMDLRRYTEHFVLPDGSPAPQKKKKQGKGPGKTTVQLDDGVKVHEGETGHSIYLVTGKDKITVCFNKKPGGKVNPAMVRILFDRPVEAEDITIEKIARAVTSMVIIEGHEPGADVAEAFDEALGAAPTTPVGGQSSPAAASTTTRTTVGRLDVTTSSATVSRGSSIELVLSYQVEVPAGTTTVSETRTLTIGGQLVPGYPVYDSIERTAGSYTSTYQQPVPSSASAGTYEFKGEVCVGGDCISRTATFRVDD